MQLTARASPAFLSIPNEFVRQVPAFLNVHHAGSVGVPDARSTTISRPDACAPVAAEISVPSSNEPTSVFVPVFLLQAKALLSVPPSPRHRSHFRFTPGPADATVAVIARSMPHSRVAFFIFCLRKPLHREGVGGYCGDPGLDARGRGHLPIKLGDPSPLTVACERDKRTGKYPASCTNSPDS